MKRDTVLARKVALSCQILARVGLVKETTGHVSTRNSDGSTMLIRGRGKGEKGLLFTRASDVVMADFDGNGLEKKARLRPPNEACIRGEL